MYEPQSSEDCAHRLCRHHSKEQEHARRVSKYPHTSSRQDSENNSGPTYRQCLHEDIVSYAELIDNKEAPAKSVFSATSPLEDIRAGLQHLSRMIISDGRDAAAPEDEKGFR